MSADKTKPIAFGDRDLTDVILVVEKQEFIVHKVILAARSHVFKRKLYGEHANQDRIEIKDVSPTAFQHLLELLYDAAVKDRDYLFPSTCDTVQGESATQDVRRIFSPHSPMLQLLQAADQFNLSRMVVRELQDAFNEIGCECKYCTRCIPIYLFLVEGGGSTTLINRTFDRPTVAAVAREIAYNTADIPNIDYSKLKNWVHLLEHLE